MAAFGLARIRAARADVDGAVAAYRLVPAQSSAYRTARAGLAELLTKANRGLPDLAEALRTLDDTSLSARRRAELTTLIYREALETVEKTGNKADVRLGAAQGHPQRPASRARGGPARAGQAHPRPVRARPPRRRGQRHPTLEPLVTDIPTTGAPHRLVPAHPVDVPPGTDSAHATVNKDGTGATTARGATTAPAWQPHHRAPAPPAARPTPAESSFCEACGADLVVAARRDGTQPPAASDGTVLASATPQTAPAGEESPLDVGWTGAVPSAAVAPAPATDDLTVPGLRPGPHRRRLLRPLRHPAAQPARPLRRVPRGLGRRRVRHRQAPRPQRGRHVAQRRPRPPGSRAVLVVCDGVSMATDSHIASLAAAKAARAVLDQPFPKGVGTPDAWAAGAAPRPDHRRGPRQRGRRRRPSSRTCPTRRRAPSPPRSSRTTSSSRATSATAASTGCPTPPPSPRASSAATTRSRRSR